jgi:hypothetical protein
MALHGRRPEWLKVAFDDADLQRVVETWASLPAGIRTAISSLAGFLQKRRLAHAGGAADDHHAVSRFDDVRFAIAAQVDF